MSSTLPQIERHTCIVKQPDGNSTSIKVRAGKPVLGALDASGIKIVQVGCQGGGCGVCRVRVLEGEYKAVKMSRRFITEADEAEGFVLACRLIPLGDLVIETFEKSERN